MSDDRDYMRADGSRARWSLTIILMVAIGVAYLVQCAPRLLSQEFIDEYLALSVAGLRSGYVWQLFTFQFLHGGLVHLLFNLLALFFLGRPVEAQMPPRRFLLLYFGSGALGGLFQVILAMLAPAHFGDAISGAPAGIWGASAGISGLLAAWAMLAPETEMLLWLVVPVKARYLLWFTAAVELLFTVFSSGSKIAHAAHLGGLFVGVMFIRLQLDRRPLGVRWNRLGQRRRKKEMIKAAQVTGLPSALPLPGNELSTEEFISRQVDPILEKISAHGIQSLTPREKKILEAAREKMARR